MDMNTKILACETLKDEIMFVMNQCGVTIPIIWVESGLHNVPKKLHTRLQEEIDKIENCDRLILLFGMCGNSVVGIHSEKFEMIIPKVDDCISLLFGSDEKRRALGGEHASYFMTDGWMRGERNLWVEYEYSVKKYGKETADSIAEMMYGNYKTLALLDTGVNDMEKLMEDTEKIEKQLGLKRMIVPATLDYVTELINGPWPEDKYYILKPGNSIEHI